MLKTREFKKLGIVTKLLGFGCMRFPTKDGEIDEEKAELMLDTAYKAGVNYFDTAYVYHGGKSEEFVGRVLAKYPRDTYYIATKLPVWSLQSKEDVRKVIDEQFARLNKDVIDFYLLHSMQKKAWDKALEYGALEIIEEYRKAGKIKYVGFSFHDSYEVFEEIINYYDWDFCQIQFNYVDTEIQAGYKGYKLAEEKGIPMVIMEPIKGGSLASLPKEVSKPFRKAHPDWSDASWALRFVASHENVKVILSGMSTLEQVQDNLKTFECLDDLSKEDLEVINEVANTLKQRTKNGCTGCRYCMPCPAGVDIPNNFSAWNIYYKYESENAASWAVRQVKASEGYASKCVECGACEAVCPQHLNIREDLKKIKEEMKKFYE